MSVLCPECKSRSLNYVRALELPPDSYNDEIVLQIARCDHCGFHAFAVYKESRHGALDSEAWSHEGYRVSEEDFQAVLDWINRCPRPMDTNCECYAHQSLGQMRGYSWDGFRLSGVKILGKFIMENNRATRNLFLREVVEDDLPVFFDFQLDPEANRMAAFTAKDPHNREAFTAHWIKIMADPTVIIKTIVSDGQVVGSVLSYEDEGKPEVSYWIGKAYWGKGIATWALSEFLAHGNPARPMYARVAKDNLGSRRVLEKCGFKVIGESQGFANARGEEIEELLLELQENAEEEGR